MKAIIALLLLSLAAAALLWGRLLRRYTVPDGSMRRAYEPGQTVLVESLSYRLRTPRMGEVVLVRWPRGGTAGDSLAIRRVAAVPGQTIGEGSSAQALGSDDWYLLGDSRDESTDSRQFGLVATEDIIGRVVK